MIRAFRLSATDLALLLVSCPWQAMPAVGHLSVVAQLEVRREGRLGRTSSLGLRAPVPANLHRPAYRTGEEDLRRGSRPAQPHPRRPVVAGQPGARILTRDVSLSGQ